MAHDDQHVDDAVLVLRAAPASGNGHSQEGDFAVIDRLCERGLTGPASTVIMMGATPSRAAATRQFVKSGEFRVRATRPTCLRNRPPAVRTPLSPKQWNSMPALVHQGRAAALLSVLFPAIALAAPFTDYRAIEGIEAVASGTLHTCILLDRRVLCTGVNEHGQLGRDDVFSAMTPSDVVGLPPAMVAATAGGRHTCSLATDGEVWCWGDNTSGQTGSGTTAPRTFPGAVPGLSASRIDAGDGHSCAVTTSGGAVCWGLNSVGQLGDGTLESRHLPVVVSGLPADVRDVAAGYDHSCALLADGTVRCWGAGDHGQLGHGEFADSTTPVPVSGVADAIAIAAGQAFSCALRATGAVICWGDGRYGATGSDTFADVATPMLTNLETPAVFVSAGRSHVCAGVQDGKVWCWGLNSTAQLGAGGFLEASPQPVLVQSHEAVLEHVQAISAGGAHTCALSNGRGLCWGLNTEGQQGYGRALRRRDAVQPTGLTAGIVNIGTSYTYACAVTSSHQLRCWGFQYILDTGNYVQAPIALPEFGAVTDVSVSEWHFCAIEVDGGVLCQGYNGRANLGDGTIVTRMSPVRAIGLANIKAITARNDMSCALSDAGDVKCWGYKYGTTTLPPSELIPEPVEGLGGDVDALVGGYDFACALRDGTVHCWGKNSSGQLGDGTRISRVGAAPVQGLENVISIAAGEVHACALTATHAMFCWGASNSLGQPGDGSMQSSDKPVAVQGLPTDVVSIHAGIGATCAITSDGSTWCWGDNQGAELANGTRERALLPVRARALPEPMASVDIGWWFGCGRTRDGDPRCWGENRHAALGDTGQASLSAAFMAPMMRYIGPQGIFRDTFQWRP